MIGTIERVYRGMPCAIIRGGDSVEYFLHKNDYDRHDKFKVGDRVEFEIHDDGKQRPSAVNAKFIGCGERHPFCNIISQVIEYIEQNTADCVSRQCRLRDLRYMYEFIANRKCTSEELRDIALTEQEYRRENPIDFGRGG